MPAVLLAVWIALAVYLAAVAYGLFRAVTRGLKTMRAFKRTNGALADRLAALTAAATETERKATAASESTAELSTALERLQRSLAELQVLRAAAAEAAAGPASLRNFIPRK
jgi:type II secretory pathway component PulF